MNEFFEKALPGSGADRVGFAGVRGNPGPNDTHLARVVSIGVRRHLNENTLRFLDELKKMAVRIFRNEGCRYLGIPAGSDRKRGSFMSKLYPLMPHKVAATPAGPGWVRRNGL